MRVALDCNLIDKAEKSSKHFAVKGEGIIRVGSKVRFTLGISGAPAEGGCFREIRWM
jgi:hypothetical protein